MDGGDKQYPSPFPSPPLTDPPMTTEPIRSSSEASSGDADDHPSPRTNRRVVAASVMLSLLWPALAIASYASYDALLSVGIDGPAREAIQAEIPDLRTTDHVGHDGQQFYMIARHPFDPDAVAGSMDSVSYRYRRILFPALAGLIAPGGGRPLIGAFLLLSLIGVGLGAWSLSRLPGSRWWLPLAMAFSPGVAAAMGLSLSDALAAGLGLLAVALANSRRWAAMVFVLAAAALTRETMLLFALGMSLVPGMPWRVRVAASAVPTIVLAAWVAWVTWSTGTGVSDNSSSQFAFPFAGWFSVHTPTTQRLLLFTSVGVVIAGAWRCRRSSPHVAFTLGLTAVMMICIADVVAFNWVNSMRPMAAAIPLALWAVTAEPSAAPSSEEPEPVAGTSGPVPHRVPRL